MPARHSQRISRPQKSWHTGYRDGLVRGMSAGRNNGFKEGLYKHLHEQLLDDGLPKSAVRVMYVTSGISVPYLALDEAIIRAFYGLAGEIIVASPSDNIAELARIHRPDLCIALNGVVLPTDQVMAVRDLGIRTAIWFTDDPYYTDWTVDIAVHYDIVFTLEISCVSLYKEAGCQEVHFLPFAVDPAQFYPAAAEFPYHTDISFVGTAYWNRVKLIDEIAPLLSECDAKISGYWWDRLNHYSMLKSKVNLGVWMTPEDTSASYNGAKIVLNIHRAGDDPTMNHNERNIPAVSVNPRMFEINACASFQIADNRQELEKFFTPGREIIVFDSAPQLEEQIRYYLKHEDERREIAFNGFVRTMKEHTYRRRIYQMLTIMLNSSN